MERPIINSMFKIQSPTQTINQNLLKKEIAKPEARKLLREKSQGLIAETGEGITAFNPKDSWWNGRIDMKQAVQNAKMYVKSYENTLPETLNPDLKNQMWKRAKQLKDEFSVGMLSREELHPVKGFLENGTTKYVVDEEKLRVNRSAEREAVWNKKNESKINEYKNLMRHLNPDDPNAGDIERFRPHRKM